MKLSKRIISIFLAVLIISSLCCEAFAVSGSTSGSSNVKGGNSKTFYVTTTSSCLSHSVKLKFSTGTLTLEGLESLYSGYSYYGFWTVTVYKQSGSSWVQYSKNNVKNCSSYSVSLPRNANCKIVVYAWNTSTVGKSVSWPTTVSLADRAYAVWKTCPSWWVSSYSRCG